MQDLFKKISDLNATTMGPCISAGISSWWISTESDMQESSLSGNLSNNMMNPLDHCETSKQLGVHFQDQESSSTQSTGQSYPEVASVETKGYGKSVLLSGSCRTNLKADEDQSKSALSCQDHGFPHSPIDYKQLVCFPLPYPYTYHCGFVSAYGPFPVVHSQMMGMTATRVPLPPDPLHDEPIYVNAKQRRAILRRRQFRAKLEAQNKLPKVRKPYLHESRHRHALNRARGSGGRFLDSKKLQDSKPSSKAKEQDISDSMQLQLNTKSIVSEVHEAENDKEGNSISTSSEITSASNSVQAFHPREHWFSVCPSQTGGSLPAGGLGMMRGTQQYLSLLQ